MHLHQGDNWREAVRALLGEEAENRCHACAMAASCCPDCVIRCEALRAELKEEIRRESVCEDDLSGA